MDKHTCWTCRFFIYSGELDVGECTFDDKMVVHHDSCDEHPDMYSYMNDTGEEDE